MTFGTSFLEGLVKIFPPLEKVEKWEYLDIIINNINIYKYINIY